MKRFSPREFALLCSPLLIVAVVGFLFSRRKPPAIEETRLHLQFHLDKPTTLQAFEGVDAVLKVELKGTNADKFDLDGAPLLEVKTAQGTQASHQNVYSGLWVKVWKGNINGDQWPINSRAIPAGPLHLTVNAKVTPHFGSTPTPGLRHLSGQWTINRSKIAPPALGKVARPPLVVLRSVKIARVAPGGGTMFVRGECTFDLTGAAMNGQTPVEISFSGGGYSTGRGGISGVGWSLPSASSQKPAQRVPSWNVSSIPARSARTRTIERIGGRISVANRWPLAFQIEPFDIARVKVGQQLKFKSWPVAPPKT